MAGQSEADAGSAGYPLGSAQSLRTVRVRKSRKATTRSSTAATTVTTQVHQMEEQVVQSDPKAVALDWYLSEENPLVTDGPDVAAARHIIP